MQATNGRLYGMSGGNGANCVPYGCGTVFSLSLAGIGPFVETDISAGHASYVPTGATSGTAKVVTPGGTLLSNVPFRVLP